MGKVGYRREKGGIRREREREERHAADGQTDKNQKK